MSLTYIGSIQTHCTHTVRVQEKRAVRAVREAWCSLAVRVRTYSRYCICQGLGQAYCTYCTDRRYLTQKLTYLSENMLSGCKPWECECVVVGKWENLNLVKVSTATVKLNSQWSKPHKMAVIHLILASFGNGHQFQISQHGMITSIVMWATWIWMKSIYSTHY